MLISTRAGVSATGLVLALLAVLPSAGRSAEGPSASMFSLGGFGTFGAVRSSESLADFVSSQFSANGAGYTRPWSSDVDSRFGAQVLAQFTPQLSAMLQVIAEQNYDNTYRPHVEWANIKYQLTPQLSIRAGRTVLPSFLYSDTRKIGYANPWVRPPIEAYGLVPVTTSDGVDVSYRLTFGEFTNTTIATYGQSTARSPDGTPNIARRLLVLADTLERGAMTLHVVYVQTDLTVDALNPLFDAFRQFGQQGSALADRYDVNNRRVRTIGVGALYDPGGWFAVGEWGASNLHSVLGKRTAWYVSGGYRLAKFTPYVMLGAIQADGRTHDAGLNVAGLPPNLAGAALGLNAALNGILASSPDQRTISVGMRWDLMKNVDFKLQADHMRLGAGSPGTLMNVQPEFRPGGTVNIISATVDFVF